MKVGFEITRGSGWKGDIAIDDVVLSPGLCCELECNFSFCLKSTTMYQAILKMKMTILIRMIY